MSGRFSDRTGGGLWEAAAQAERTGLSWHRTAMALAVTLLLLMRGEGTAVAQIVVAAGMLSMVCILVLPTIRYLRTANRLTAGCNLPGATPLMALAAILTMVGTGAIVAILTNRTT